MLNHNEEAVLIDFGVSALVDKESDALTSNMGSYMFFAPEMFQMKKRGEILGKSTDIWALGITLFYILCGKYPFEEATNPCYLKELVLEKEINFEWIKHIDARELL